MTTTPTIENRRAIMPESLEKRITSIEKRFIEENKALNIRMDSTNARIDGLARDVSDYRLELTTQFQEFTKEMKEILHEHQENQTSKECERLAIDNKELKDRDAERKKHYTRSMLSIVMSAVIPPIVLYILLAFSNMTP